MHLDESRSAAPYFSPGVVKDNENLIRELFNPEHIVNGELKPAAIPVTDLLNRGYSVHRINYVSKSRVEKFIQERLGRNRRGEDWTFEGAVKLSTDSLRLIEVESEKALVIIDTALKENCGHASIYSADPSRGKAHARMIREQLLPLFQDRKPLNEIYKCQPCFVRYLKLVVALFFRQKYRYITRVQRIFLVKKM